MKVLMLSKACLVGSYQTKLEAVAQHEDIDLTVIVPPIWYDPSGPVKLERAHTKGYNLLVDPIRFNGQFHTYYFPKLRQRLAAIKPDVVHIDEEPYNLATWLSLRQARRIGAKSLFFSWQNLQRTYPFPFSLLEKQVLANIDYAIMGNQASVKVWRQKGYRGPAKVIPQFGVDETMFSPAPQRDAGRGFVIGSANRRLVPEKGVDLLLCAAARLPGVWRLHIAGDGPERASLERLARQLDIGDRVQFDGVVTSAQMPAYLQQLDTLVLASRTLPNWKEQFGRVLIEAMACEVAVIGSDSGEIPNVIGEAGLIFPENDEVALHQHLRQLMQSITWREDLGKNGRQRVLDHYTQSKIANETVVVYRQMLDGTSKQNH